MLHFGYAVGTANNMGTVAVDGKAKREWTTYSFGISTLEHLASHVKGRQGTGAGRVHVNAGAVQAEEVAHPVRDHAGQGACGRHSLDVVWVHGRHADVVLGEGGREDGRAGPVEGLCWDPGCIEGDITLSVIPVLIP